MSQGAQRFPKGRGMMREIVDHLYSSRFSTHFLAPGDSFETLERFSNSVDRHAVETRSRYGHRGVADVELADQRNLILVLTQGEARPRGRTIHLANLLGAVRG